MADDITLPGHDQIVATDQIGTKHYQLSKLVLGDMETNDGPVSKNNPLPVLNSLAVKVLQGKFFAASSTQSVIAGATGTWKFSNPASSGKTLYLVYVSLANNQTDQIRFTLHKNSTFSGTAVTPFNVNLGSSAASIAVVEYGTGARSGGTDLSAVLPVVRDQRYEFNGFVVIPEATSLEISGLVPGTLTTQQLTAGARWYEE